MCLEGGERERVLLEGGGFFPPSTPPWAAVRSARRQTSEASHNISAAKRRSSLSMLWRPAAVINNGKYAKLSPEPHPHRPPPTPSRPFRTCGFRTSATASRVTRPTIDLPSTFFSFLEDLILVKKKSVDRVDLRHFSYYCKKYYI